MIRKVFDSAKPDEIVSGGARGVDTFGEIYARDNCIKVKVFPADWNTHGKKAGYLRNVQMAEYADALLAIWDGESKGTKHMIDTMKRMNKQVYVVLAPEINTESFS
jgi:hypothetical protein